MSESTTRQPRWPAGTPVAPSGHGPGGGRFRPAGGAGHTEGMSLARLRAVLALGLPYEVRITTGWVVARQIDRDGTLHYETPGGQTGTFNRETYLVREYGGHETVPDWATRMSAMIEQPRPRPLTAGMLTHEEVASYLGRTDYRVAGKRNGAYGEVEFREYSDGTRLAYKTSLGYESDEEIRNEVQASLVARALGAPVAAVVRDPDNPAGLLMAYIEESQRIRLDGVMGSLRGQVYDQAALSPEGRMIGLLDVIVGNGDRHSLNIRFEEHGEAPIGIDQGLAFQAARYRGAAQTANWPEIAKSKHYAARLIRDSRHPYHSGDLVQWYYSPEAIDEARRRIESIRDELDPDVWAGIDATLSILRPVSTGGHWLDQ